MPRLSLICFISLLFPLTPAAEKAGLDIAMRTATAVLAGYFVSKGFTEKKNTSPPLREEKTRKNFQSIVVAAVGTAAPDFDGVKGDLSQCIRYYWNSKNPFVRDDDLFPAISKEKNINKIKSTFDEIVETSALYIEMISPRIGGSFTDRSVEALANLRTMSATSFFPLIFALKSEKNDDDIIEAVLVQIETMVFRNQAIMKKTANKNEVFFSRTAEAVSRGELSATEVMQNIASNTSNDIEVEAAFKGYKTKSTMVGRMILTSLYNHEHPELKINSGRAVHIEHIMPQTKGMWNIDDDTWIEYKDRIGNMVLLDGKKNISASNDLFDQKKERYLKSDIIDTREIAKYDKWGPEEIDERQSELLKKVLLRWPKYNQN